MSRRKKPPPPSGGTKSQHETLKRELNERLLDHWGVEHHNGKPTDERAEFALLSLYCHPDGTPPTEGEKALVGCVFRLVAELQALAPLDNSR